MVSSSTLLCKFPFLLCASAFFQSDCSLLKCCCGCFRILQLYTSRNPVLARCQTTSLEQNSCVEPNQVSSFNLHQILFCPSSIFSRNFYLFIGICIHNNSPFIPILIIAFLIGSSRISSTQPEPRIRNDIGCHDDQDEETRTDFGHVCFSQPLYVDDLILTQTQATPGSSQVSLLLLSILLSTLFGSYC